MGLWQSLTQRRTLPKAPAWAAAAAFLFLAAYGGWAALRPEGPPVKEIRAPAELLQDSRETIADVGALVQAVSDGDQDRVEHLNGELQDRARREAEREGRRAAAVTAARTRYGSIAVLNFVLAVWLLAAARQPRRKP